MAFNSLRKEGRRQQQGSENGRESMARRAKCGRSPGADGVASRLRARTGFPGLMAFDRSLVRILTNVAGKGTRFQGKGIA